MKFDRQMLNHIEKQQILLQKIWQFTTPFKEDIRKLADLKQQILQKLIVTFWRCAAK